MQEQLPGFIRTAEALQIKGLAAVNNYSNNNNVENLSLKPNSQIDANYFYNNNNIINNNNNNSSSCINNNIESLNMKFPQPPTQQQPPQQAITTTTTLPAPPTQSSYSSQLTPPETKYDISKLSPPLQQHPAESPPLSRHGKKRRHGASPPQARSCDSETTPSSPHNNLSDVSSSSPLKRSSSPLYINDTIHSLGLSGNPASMASISMAKAISLSKLVHEISSQASIASLKSAALPPHHSPFLPEDGRDDGDYHVPHTPPPLPPTLPPTAHLQNTSESYSYLLMLTYHVTNF